MTRIDFFSLAKSKYELERFSESISDIPEGCEACTHIALDGEKAAECFLLGKARDGSIGRAVFSYGGTSYSFNNGVCDGVFGKSELTVFGEIIGERLCRAVYTGKLPNAPDNVERLSGTDIIKAFELITDRKMSDGDNERYVFRVRASNRSLASVFAIFDRDGRIASTASVIAENEKYALIGDVFTRPDQRNGGYAKSVCLASCRAALLKGKTPFLLCEARLLPYYEKLGFVELK